MKKAYVYALEEVMKLMLDDIATKEKDLAGKRVDARLAVDSQEETATLTITKIHRLDKEDK